METTEVAHGIVEIANAAMAGALRRISIQRGFDPRDFALVAFGGAGPLHANRLAAELEIPAVIVPRSPGTFSAMGLLATDLRHEYSATSVQRLETLKPADLISVFDDLENQGQTALAREGVPSSDMRFEKLIDLRYVGQSYELAIHVSDEKKFPDQMRRLNDEFHAEHRRVYGFNAPEEPIEAVNLRLSAMGNISKPALQNAEPGKSPGHARKSDRDIYFCETGKAVPCPVFDRYELGAGCAIDGPAVVEEMDSTTLVHPGYTLSVDPFGNLVIEQA
jgi:N-methylhydantoinase A